MNKSPKLNDSSVNLPTKNQATAAAKLSSISICQQKHPHGRLSTDDLKNMTKVSNASTSEDRQRR